MPYDFASLKEKLQKVVDHVATDAGTLRTGKATVQLLDPVTVSAYGSKMKINEVANVTAPDPTLLVITPWDKSLMGEIEKGIQISGLNLQAIVSGDVIRVPVPPLTEERRKEMVKLLAQKLESGRVMLRTVRTDAKKELEAQKGQTGISEDDIENDIAEMETVFQEMENKISALGKDKEKELMSL